MFAALLRSSGALSGRLGSVDLTRRSARRHSLKESPRVKLSPPSGSTRLPFVVFLLAVGIFLMCTSEFLIAGLLPEMAADFGISQARTGLLITAFALGMIIGGPTMALATMRLPRRAALVLALSAFAAGH